MRTLGPRSVTVGLIGCCMLAALGTAPRTAAAASLEVYGRLPHLENVSLSPDGTRVAFVQTEGESRVIAVTSLTTGMVLNRVRGGEEKLRDLFWADDEHLLIETSVTTFPHGIPLMIPDSVFELAQVQIYDLGANKLTMVPQPGAFSDLKTLSFVDGRVALRSLEGRTKLFVPGFQVLGMNVATYSYAKSALLRVDLGSGTGQLVAAARPGHTSWVIDANGDVAAEGTYDERNGHWVIYTRRDGHTQETLSGKALLDIPHLLGLGPSPDTLLLQQLENEEPVWRLLSLKDGSLGPPMAERRVLEHPIEDRLTHRMIGGMHVGDSVEYVFFDPDHEKAWQAILRAFPGERVRLESVAANFRRFIVRVEGERDGYCYELVDLDSHHADPLGDVYQGLGHPLEVRRITYPAADGLEIPAYLTLPRNRAAHALPLVVLPHGGPAARDTLDFDWWSQALADQGYAVLQPNFRGSAIGRAFLARGFGEWGRKMQTDLSDGVRYLATQGVIDPARVCIVGASYGGYAALAGVSLDSGVYRCAVAVAGVSDVRRMLAWVNNRQFASNANLAQRYWDRFMGLRGPDDPGADAISPVKRIEAITAPVLLIHGKDDTVVPFEQSQEMYDALMNAHKDVELVPLKAEDHWLSRSATRLQMLTTSVAFLRKNNPPDP